MLRQLPNAITVLRILLVLPIGWAIVARRDELALWLAAIAGISDAPDGFLARRFGWFTRLGAWLDPAADKLMLTVTYVALALVGAVPWWLTILIVARDVVIVAGTIVCRWWRGMREIRPSFISKLNTSMQIVYVLVVLINLQGAFKLPAAPMLWLVALLTLASGVDYVMRFARIPSVRNPS